MKAKYRADFDLQFIKNVVVIYDLNLGNQSVTNDAENVIEYLNNVIPEFSSKKIIYQDTRGIFDELEINKKGQFIGFKSINEKTLEKALEKLSA